MLAQGEFALVKKHLDAIGDKTSGTLRLGVGENDVYYVWVDLAVQKRDESLLRQYAPLAEKAAKRDGHILYQASAHRAWGALYRLTGEYEASTERLHQALDLFQGLETHWQIGRTFSELAELSVDQNDPSGARDYYKRALASYAKVGAVPDVTRTRAAIASVDL